MGFRVGAYAKVWEVKEVSDTRTDLRISISRKDKETGGYVDDFSGYVSCFGTAAASRAKMLGDRSRIKIGDCDASARYDKEKRTTYYNFKIFSFEDVTEDGGRNSAPSVAEARIDEAAEGPSAHDLPY